MNYGDAITVAPDLHEVIFENDLVRMLRVVVPAGAQAAMHSHPRNVNYVVRGGKLQFVSPDGQVREATLTEGQVIDGLATTHQVLNVGKATVETIQTEFKS